MIRTGHRHDHEHGTISDDEFYSDQEDLAETPGAIAVAGPRSSLEQKKKERRGKHIGGRRDAVEMQKTTEVPPSVVQSNLVDALPVDEDLDEVLSEKEKADAVVTLSWELGSVSTPE
jgi:hypothetical protein